ncbi:hypothetical protein SK128_026510 [Halocaridina rubra]|uniref:Uncharacterized protein n=1 Tax=Halocaridina rubra TaxID=373956 RepID=A0AAN8WGS5_HALRR
MVEEDMEEGYKERQRTFKWSRRIWKRDIRRGRGRSNGRGGYGRGDKPREAAGVNEMEEEEEEEKKYMWREGKAEEAKNKGSTKGLEETKFEKLKEAKEKERNSEALEEEEGKNVKELKKIE